MRRDERACEACERASQSFSAPIVSPCTIDLRTKKAKTETGSTISVAAAPMPAQSIFPYEMKLYTATGTVFVLGPERISEKRNWFQEILVKDTAKYTKLIADLGIKPE